MIAGLTLHAAARMQQRGIPESVLNLLLDFGEATHDHRGGEIVFFGRRSLRRVEQRMGKDAIREIERHRAIYAVVASGGVVATVGHRRKRIPK